MHFNTFQLTDEPIYAPASDLKAAVQASEIGSEDFKLLREGEGLNIP